MTTAGAAGPSGSAAASANFAVGRLPGMDAAVSVEASRIVSSVLDLGTAMEGLEGAAAEEEEAESVADGAEEQADVRFPPACVGSRV